MSFSHNTGRNQQNDRYIEVTVFLRWLLTEVLLYLHGLPNRKRSTSYNMLGILI